MLRHFFTRFTAAAAFSAALIALLHAEDFQGAGHKLEYEALPILYHEQAPDDAVAQLQRRLAAGDTKLGFDDRFGYLPALLDELKIPRSSQSLVFSKTSFQRTFISPDNPRAIYFNDDVYIGFIPGAPALEISAVDPKLGAVFYRLENEKVRRPRFTRDQDCLRCHGAQRTLGVPGHFVRSIGTDENGELDTQSEVNDIAFLRFLLFTEEAPLTAAIQGDPAYLADFLAPARRDAKGRSLRDFDLQTRLFKHPCSYLIYSPAFEALPSPMREQLLARLYDILTGKDRDPQFAPLATADRQAILEILRETKPNLPDYWRKS